MKTTAFRIDAILLFIGASLLPIYAFSSGGIQPAHVSFAAFATLVLAYRGLPTSAWSALLLALSIYSFIIETLYAIMGGEPRFLINAIFFFYNFIVGAAVYKFVSVNGLSTLIPGIIVAAAISLTTLWISGVDLREFDELGRATSTFNNPNQLGYFSVCILSFGYLFYRNGSVAYWLAVCIFSTSLFLSIASLSKAAMIANFLVIIFALKPTLSRSSLSVWVIGAIIGGALIYRMLQSGMFDEYLFLERLSNIANEQDSSLGSRGYFAFLEGNALQLVFGLGAQGVDDIVGHEVHSTFASVINNYGIIGFLIFVSMYFVWVIRIRQFYGYTGLICLVGPSTLYGITHNGIRFTIFWLLFASSLGLAENYKRNRRQWGMRVGPSSKRQIEVTRDYHD